MREGSFPVSSRPFRLRQGPVPPFYSIRHLSPSSGLSNFGVGAVIFNAGSGLSYLFIPKARLPGIAGDPISGLGEKVLPDVEDPTGEEISVLPLMFVPVPASLSRSCEEC
jgi:hypothetical protein